MNGENQDNQQVQADAERFDVPMPDICAELDWQEPTFFYWYRRVDTMPYRLCTAFFTSDKVSLRSIEDNTLIDTFYKDVFHSRKYAIPAPIARQIAKLLPEKVEASIGNGETAFAYLTILVHGEVAYYLNYTDRYVSWEEIADYEGEDADSEAAIPFEKFHIAQGLGEMYLKLKQIGLLEKEVQDA